MKLIKKIVLTVFIFFGIMYFSGYFLKTQNIIGSLVGVTGYGMVIKSFLNTKLNTGERFLLGLLGGAIFVLFSIYYID